MNDIVQWYAGLTVFHIGEGINLRVFERNESSIKLIMPHFQAFGEPMKFLFNVCKPLYYRI